MFGFCLRRTVVLSVSAVFLLLPRLSFTQSSDSHNVKAMPGLDKRLIDTNADPCTDFAAYACGHYGQVHPIPADHAQWATFEVLSDYTEQELHDLLDKVSADNPGRSASVGQGLR